MGDTPRDEQRALRRVADLRKKIEQAATLIGELREKNYSLGAEVAQLKRDLDERPEQVAESSASSAPGVPAEPAEHAQTESALASELEAMRAQRQTIREKVAMLLERIEKLET